MIQYQIWVEKGEQFWKEFQTDNEREARDALRDLRAEYNVQPGGRVRVYLDEVECDDSD